MAGLSLAALSAAACTRQPPEEIVPYVRQPERLMPGDAALVRHRHGARRQCARPARAQPRGPADQAGGQSGSPDEPRPHATCMGRPRSTICTIPRARKIVRHGRGAEHVGGFPRRAAGAAARAGGSAQGQGLRAAHRALHFAHPARAARRARGRSTRRRASIRTIRRCRRPAAEMRCDLDDGGDDRLDRLRFSRQLVRSPRDALAFARRRSAGKPIRLHVLESMPSLTGAMADRRYPLKPSDLENAAAAELIGVVQGRGASRSSRGSRSSPRNSSGMPGKAAILVGRISRRTRGDARRRPTPAGGPGSRRCVDADQARER